MVTRGRSVPAPAPPPASSSDSNNVATPSPPSTSSITPSGGILTTTAVSNNTSKPKLLVQADALARMTIELNLRAVSSQAERLEKELKTLVMCTVQDKEFRESHEKRLQDMWREILVVKKRMEEVEGPQGGSGGENGKVDLEKSERDAANSINELKQEMEQLRGLVTDISSTLDRLPTVAEAESLLGLENSQFSASETTRTTTTTRAEKNPNKSQYWNDSQATPTQRIQDALSSTRRWNRDHKTTSLSDAAFTKNYLKQQSKRDPHIAVYIQRAIQRRVHRSGRLRGKIKARPESLEQFCQHVKWKDVIETVEEALVRDEQGAMKALGK